MYIETISLAKALDRRRCKLAGYGTVAFMEGHTRCYYGHNNLQLQPIDDERYCLVPFICQPSKAMIYPFFLTVGTTSSGMEARRFQDVFSSTTSCDSRLSLFRYGTGHFQNSDLPSDFYTETVLTTHYEVGIHLQTSTFTHGSSVIVEHLST